VLGVARNADEKTIKDAFRTLAMKYHPDRNKEPDAESKFKESAAAYAILSDPKRRADYDAGGHAGVDASMQDLFGGLRFDDLFGGLGFDFGGGLFERFFGRRAGRPESGANIEVDLSIPLERVRIGGEEEVSYSRREICAACKGNGAKGGTALHDCPACKGTGERTRSARKTKDAIIIQRIGACPECGGRGRIVDAPCPDCRGLGSVERVERLQVKIPPGIEDGMALRVPGRGVPPQSARGVPGDLYVVVRTARDPRFERDGADLWRTEAIALTDAVLGTALQVPTLTAPMELAVPPGTQPGTVLRLRGCGLPRFSAVGQGDLNVRIEVRVPQRLSAEERSLYERLRSLHAHAGRGQS